MSQIIYPFRPSVLSPEQFGLKAANLSRMAHAGLRVPAALAVKVAHAMKPLRELDDAAHHVHSIAVETHEFAKQAWAATVSVRSSPTRSMPGMLRTALGVPSSFLSHRDAVASVVASVEAPHVKQWARITGTDVEQGILAQEMVHTAAPGDLVGVFEVRPSGLTGEFVPHRTTGVPPDAVVSGRERPAPADGMNETAWRVVEPLLDGVLDVFQEPTEVELVVSGGVAYALQARPVAKGVVAKHPELEREADHRGLGVSRGFGEGVIVWGEPQAKAALAEDLPYVLAADYTTPDDLGVIAAASAVVTLEGGYHSHAATVCRQLGVPAVAGVDVARLPIRAADDSRGFLGVDGTRGLVYELSRADAVGRMFAVPEMIRVSDLES